jgi:PAS domain S-box-containing protein
MNEEYRLLFDAAPHPMWVAEPDTHIHLAVNQACLDQYGYSRAEFLALRHTAICERLQDGVAPHRRKDGSVFFADVTLADVGFAGRAATLVCSVDVSARVDAEQRVHQSETKFRALFETSPDAVGLIRGEVHVLVNPAYAEMFGFGSPDELKNTSLLGLFAASQRARVAGFLGARQGGHLASGAFQTRGLRRNGAEFEIDLRVSEFVENGEVYSVLVLRDISALHAAFDALARSERSLAEAQRIASLGHWELDLSLNTLRWSDEIYRIFGLEFGVEPSRELFYAHVHPQDRALVREAVDGAVREHQPYSIDHRILRPDGSERWVHEHAQVFPAADGVRLAGTVQDITRRHEAEERLRLLESVVVNANDGVVLWEPGDGASIVWMNEAYGRLTGRSAADTQGEPVEILRDPNGNGQNERIRQALERRESVRAEILLKRLDKTESTTEVNIFPLFESGSLTHWAAIVRDISERRRLEAQLFQSQKMEAVGRLAGGVAHDFNNLLLIISGYANMLRDAAGPGDATIETIDQITRATDRAGALTRQLLVFSRRHETRREIIDLNRVVMNIEKMLRRVIGEDVELRTELTPAPATISGDPAKIEQVLMNLAVNARDAMPDGGSLTVRIERRSPSEICLTVADTGHGMDPETQALIFEPFFTTKPEDAGTGLGLSLVYGIVKQLGGDILVKSAPGAGAVFEISLPSAEAAEEELAPENPAAPRSGNATILLVEDDPGVRQLIAVMLRRRGYAVRDVSGGAEAIPLIESTQPIDLLLTDIVMPGMNGWTLAECAVKKRPGLKVLYMSGYSDHAMIQRDRLEAVTLLNKPFTIETLSAAIHDVLAAKTRRAQ